MPFQDIVCVGGVVVGEHEHEPGKSIFTYAVLGAVHTDRTGEGTAGAGHHGVGLQGCGHRLNSCSHIILSQLSL